MFEEGVLQKRYLEVLEQMPSDVGNVLSFYREHALKNHLPYLNEIAKWMKTLSSQEEERVRWGDLENLTLAYTLLDMTMHIHTRIKEEDLFEKKVLAALMGDYCYTSFLVQIAFLPIGLQKKIHIEFSDRIEGYLKAFLAKESPVYHETEGLRSFNKVLIGVLEA